MPAPATQVSRSFWKSLALRLVIVGLGLWSTGWLLHRLATSAAADPQPPGFVGGLAHGVLMPMALPRLLLGYDAEIYAQRNSGRTYKLGYTCGVNGCGAIFFGMLYRRRSRLPAPEAA